MAGSSLPLILAMLCLVSINAQFRLDKWRAGRQGFARSSRTSCRLGERCEYFTNCLMSRGRISGTCSIGFQSGVCCRTIDSFYITMSRLRQLLGYRRIPNNNVIPNRRIVTTTTAPERWKRRKECGVRQILPGRQARIVNGSNAVFGEFPWQVLISGSEDSCGGAILSDQWVITAAHCVHSEDVSDIRIRAGELDIHSTNEPLREQNRTVDEVIIHENFNSTSYEYDLALLKLSEPIIFAPHIQPICLPQIFSNYIGRYGLATGWGEIYPDGLEANILQKVALPIVNSQTCMNMFLRSDLKEDIPSFFICAGYNEGQKDACQGDSGGPLQVRESDGSYVLVGIMSWGIGCAEPNQPGVYTKVSDFVSWIREHSDMDL